MYAVYKIVAFRMAFFQHPCVSYPSLSPLHIRISLLRNTECGVYSLQYQEVSKQPCPPNRAEVQQTSAWGTVTSTIYTATVSQTQHH